MISRPTTSRLDHLYRNPDCVSRDRRDARADAPRVSVTVARDSKDEQILANYQTDDRRKRH